MAKYTLHFGGSHTYDPDGNASGGMTKQNWIDEYADEDTIVNIYGDDGYWIEMEVWHKFQAASDREAQLYVEKYMADEELFYTVKQGNRYAFTEEDDLIKEPEHAADQPVR